ncbi:4'-phosphopantetheinyl transferase superfamily protein [bacterium]|nr:4'-phosphopantetheinyl transferase superfamily protein [bacterium]
MALVHSFSPQKNSIIGYWKFEESVDDLIARVEDLHFNLEKFYLINSTNRKIEWLSTRLLLHELLPENNCDIYYSEFGKPHLSSTNKHISISHSKGMCAMYIGDQSNGVDLQILKNNIESIAHKYLDNSELKLIQSQLEDYHILWCTKEAVFKAYGRKKIFLKKNIFVQSINKTENKVVAQLIDENYTQNYLLKYLYFENYYLVYTLNV